MLPPSGRRVIAVEQYAAGPYGTMPLADLGAEVIKIKNPAEGATWRAGSTRLPRQGLCRSGSLYMPACSPRRTFVKPAWQNGGCTLFEHGAAEPPLFARHGPMAVHVGKAPGEHFGA
jgi:hypothetical protein